MASTNKTDNLNLSQFVDTDKPAWLTDYNGDMQMIDSALSEAGTEYIQGVDYHALKMANGTMICWRNITFNSTMNIKYGATNFYITNPCNLPAFGENFVGGVSVTADIGAEMYATAKLTSRLDGFYGTSVRLWAMSVYPADSNVQFSVSHTAIGRWK